MDTTMEPEANSHSPFGCLPLALQDLCLIHLINDLDSYPIKWLASLPRHLRSRLLHNLPVYDICLLDHSPVADGIDINQVLTSREADDRWLTRSNPQYVADFFVSRNRYFKFTKVSAHTNLLHTFDMDPELCAAFSTDRQLKEDILLGTLWNILSHDLQYHVPSFDLLSVKGHQLLWDSILLYDDETETTLNLIDSFPEQKKVYDDYYQLWLHSGCGLSVHRSVVAYGTGETRLIPRHLLPIYLRSDPLELLNLIVLDCGLSPVNLCMDVAMLHKVNSTFVSPNIQSGRLLTQQFFKVLLSKIKVLMLTNVSPEHHNTLRDIMEAVVGNGGLKSLEIVCESPTLVPVSVLIFNTYTSDKNSMTPNWMYLDFLSPYLLTLPSDGPLNSPLYQQLTVLDLGTAVDESSLHYLNALLEQQISLKHLRLCLVDSCRRHSCTRDEKQLYSLLLRLFDRDMFQTLGIHFVCRVTYKNITYHTTECHNYRLFPLVELFYAFMHSQCANKKSLLFEQMCASFEETLPRVCIPDWHDTEELTLNSLDPISDCGLNCKTLCYYRNDFYFIVSHLVKLPVIRLRELVLNLTRETLPLFSCIIKHPNLKIRKAVLHSDLNSTNKMDEVCLRSTLVETIESLFQMPTLNEISLCDDWMTYDDVRSSLVSGIHKQSQICSLRKLHLLDNNFSMHCHYTDVEFSELWEAIFSYPLLDKLEVVLGNSLSLVAVRLAHMITECWKNFASKKRLKVQRIQMEVFSPIDEAGEDQLSLLKQVSQEINVMTDRNK